ncbi:MAG: HAMP domain-containing protein [Desulfamplus sp.]|nr:HAMP domain-containing protein [Desulfamplus sp.]
MTLRKKILLGYGVSFALMGFVVSWGIINLISLGKTSNEILQENYKSILSAHNMLNSLERQDSAMLITFLGDNKLGITQFRENDANFLEWLTRAKGNITIKGESELLYFIETNYQSYRQLYSKITELKEIDTSSLAESLNIYKNSVYPLFLQIRDKVTQLLKLNEKTMYEASIKAEKVAVHAILSTLFVAALSFIIALSFSLFISERITNPINKFIDASREVSSGNYEVELPIQTHDELGSLAEEFNKMALQLKHYQKMSINKEVERMKNEFIMALSHELKTPLTSMGMSIDLLMEHGVHSLDKRDQELLQVTYDEIHRMKTLVNDLLELSKSESGKISLEFERVPINTLFEHVLTIFKGQSEIKHVTITTLPQFAKEMKILPNVRADANKITWVLSNLISNALRYVGDGGIIELMAANRGDGNINISVRDNGPGIPNEYQTKIFQKFIQVKGQSSGGSGLGLAICKEIINAHSGTIWVESEVGKGSVFTFTLPIYN